MSRPLLKFVVLGCLVAGCSAPETGTYIQEPTPQVQGRSDNNRPNTTNAECILSVDCGEEKVCCEGACVEPDACRGLLCERQGARCRLSPATGVDLQDEFACARLDQEQTGGSCLMRCAEGYAPGGCPSTTYCLPINIDGDSETICMPSECAADDECAWIGPYGGTCVPFGNLSGFCFSAGLVAEGGACEASARELEGLCASGLFCDRDRTGAGTCQPLCDMWLGGSECPQGKSCGFLTRGAGVCSDKTASGREPFETCEPAFSWCDDRVECLDFGTGGESLPVCSAYCRPQVPGDCIGRSFGDRQATCAQVFTNGQGEVLEDLGLCL